MRGWAITAMAILAAVAGCTMWQSQNTPPPSLPEEHQVTLQQLVVHSNFDLPDQHRLLQELDAQRTDVSQKLALPVSNEPIHVFLFQNEEQYRAFIAVRYPQFPARRAFFMETDTQLAVYAHWGDRVSEDLRHEVSHGYMHSCVRNLPLWLDEGLAEYFEVPRNDRGLNRPHVETLLALWKQGQWRPDLQRLESLESPADMTQVDYAEAWAWMHLLLETEPSRRELLQNYLRKLREVGTVEPLSLWVRQTPIEPQKTLIDHLLALQPPPATAKR